MYLGKEHWIGLDNIYKLTNRKNVKTQLKIIVEYTLANGGTTHTGTYDDFHLKDPVVCNFTYVHIIMMMKIPFFYPNLSHISLPILF